MFSFLTGVFAAISGTIGALLSGSSLLLSLPTTFFGRRLYWLFVALIGFALGLLIASRFVAQTDSVYYLALALGIGLVFALMALALNRTVISFFGALGFGALGYSLASGQPETTQFLVALIFAIIGLVLSLVLFEWALAIGSALLGAYMASSALGSFNPQAAAISGGIFIVLAIAGLFFQIRDLRQSK